MKLANLEKSILSHDGYRSKPQTFRHEKFNMFNVDKNKVHQSSINVKDPLVPLIIMSVISIRHLTYVRGEM